MTSNDCSMFMATSERGTATINENPLINLKNKVKMLLLCESSKKENRKKEKEKNNDDTNEYRHKERGGLRAINILADCPLTPTARNITQIYSRQLKCSRNYFSTVQDHCSNAFGIF